jgi:hypothetical protein
LVPKQISTGESNDPRAHHRTRQSLPSHALPAGRPCRSASCLKSP